MANFTGEGNYTSKLNQALSAPPAGIAEFFSALNIFLSITAAVGNALILVALKNVSSIHPPTKLFFRCLAVTDHNLFVGLITQPLYTSYIMSLKIKMNVNVLYYVYQVGGASSNILCGVSGLTSTAISVDRLLALLLGLRYRHVVTVRRVRVVIICFWLFAASCGLLWVWRSNMTITAASVGLLLCLATSIFCYTRIHLKLRHQQAQVQNNVLHGQQNGEGNPLNIARYKKTVSSIMWVQLALVACYVPWGIVAVLYANGIEHDVYSWLAQTLVLLNSSLNPILYCWKIREVKQAIKGTIRQLYCF
ncbi:melanocyte-stimulating hormone receptor-like [Oculina patagonica]